VIFDLRDEAMKAKEIREKTSDNLVHELAEQQKHLFDLRSQAVTEKLEDPSQLMKTKRGIARVKTILRQRELEEKKKTQASGAKAK
jgi:large subunit ribosomal protein L29